jgi:hypothetical protein
MSDYVYIKPEDTKVDPRYQRDFDEPRAVAISKRFDSAVFGVPVLSRRGDGTLVRIDGQHRLEAAILAGLGDVAVLCEVHGNLSLRDEAELFLRLNGGHTAVRVFDKFKARLVAEDPVALGITTILKDLDLKITKAQQRRGVCAIQALESAYYTHKLDQTLRVLTKWMDGDPSAYEGPLLRAVAEFLREYSYVDPSELSKRLEKHTPTKLLTRFRARQEELGCTSREAACVVLREIYNERRPGRLRLPPYGSRAEGMTAQ